MKEILSELCSAQIIMENLPESPGYNGSVLSIDDTETNRIAAAIGKARELIEQQAERIRELNEANEHHRELARISRDNEIKATRLAAQQAEQLAAALKRIETLTKGDKNAPSA